MWSLVGFLMSYNSNIYIPIQYFWAFFTSQELAREFPDSTFIGTDIIDIFNIWGTKIPQNCTFVQADTLKGLPFEDDEFDFVFQRAQMACFTDEMWPKVLQELLRVTRPGGYIEISWF